jgi:hypothetical protein
MGERSNGHVKFASGRGWEARMGGPKNLAGVLVATFWGGVLIFFCFALGWGETTRKGLPVRVGGVIGLACFAVLGVQSWRKPRRNLGDDGLDDGVRSSE